MHGTDQPGETGGGYIPAVERVAWSPGSYRCFCIYLFGSQAFGRVGNCGLERFITYGDPGQHQGGQGSEKVYRPVYPDMIGKALQPAMDGKQRERDRNDDGYQDKAGKTRRQEVDDVEGRGAQHFSYADLFGTLFGHKGRESVEAQAGDEYSQECKKFEDVANLSLALIHICEILIYKIVRERIGRVEAFCYSFQRFDRLFGCACLGADDDGSSPSV